MGNVPHVRTTGPDRGDPAILSSAVLLIVMVVQPILGLLYPSAYRDVEWIRTAWFGNDCVTLLVAAPLLGFGILSARLGSTRGLLVWLGLGGYGAYNYAFYLFGAVLNRFFVLYVLGCVLAVVTLILGLSRLDVAGVAGAPLRSKTVRFVSGYLILVGTGLASLWLGVWIAYAFFDRPAPIEPEAFKLVAALDLGVMAPALVCGGALAWLQRPWGYVIATLASIQASLYLLVLAVNAALSIHRGLVDGPGELPLWTVLAAMTTTAALLLLMSVPTRGDSSPCA